MIQFFLKKDIDKEKYSRKFEQSITGCIYAHPFFLDTISQNWGICSYGDYEVILPVYLSKKMGITYLYQPSFTQYTCFLSEKEIDKTVQKKMIAFLQKKFFLINIGLGNITASIGNITSRDTYKLPLNKPYSEIHSLFSKKCRQNIRKAENKPFSVEISNDIESHITEMKNLLLPQNIQGVDNNTLNKLLRVFLLFEQQGNIKLYQAKNTQGNVISTILFLQDNNKHIIYSATTAEGRNYQAKYKIMNQFIMDQAETDTEIDFAGSSIQSIADWNKSFGAKKETYSYFDYKKMPWLFNYLKK